MQPPAVHVHDLIASLHRVRITCTGAAEPPHAPDAGGVARLGDRAARQAQEDGAGSGARGKSASAGSLERLVRAAARLDVRTLSKMDGLCMHIGVCMNQVGHIYLEGQVIPPLAVVHVSYGASSQPWTLICNFHQFSPPCNFHHPLCDIMHHAITHRAEATEVGARRRVLHRKAAKRSNAIRLAAAWGGWLAFMGRCGMGVGEWGVEG